MIGVSVTSLQLPDRRGEHMELRTWRESGLDRLCLCDCWCSEAIEKVDPVSCFGSFLEESPAVVASRFEAAGFCSVAEGSKVQKEEEEEKKKQLETGLETGGRIALPQQEWQGAVKLKKKAWEQQAQLWDLRGRQAVTQRKP